MPWAMQVLSLNTDFVKCLSGCLYQQQNSNALTASHRVQIKNTTGKIAKMIIPGLPRGPPPQY